MIRNQEATGKTVDEARAKACALLGVQAEDLNVSYEVLEMPQKTGFLGLKTTPAKVCVSVEEPDAPAAPAAAPKRSPQPKNLPHYNFLRPFPLQSRQIQSLSYQVYFPPTWKLLRIRRLPLQMQVRYRMQYPALLPER